MILPSSLVTLSQEVASDCPLLRASNEVLLRARVPRAQRTSEAAPSLPFKLARLFYPSQGQS